MTTTLIATVVGFAAGALLTDLARRWRRRREHARIAGLARLGIELAIAETSGDTSTADQIRTEMKHRGVTTIGIIDVNEQDNQ